MNNTGNRSNFYINRDEDQELLIRLREGHSCSIFAPPKMGKDRLIKEALVILSAEGIRNSIVDFKEIHNETSNSNTDLFWAIVVKVASQLNLINHPKYKDFLDKNPNSADTVFIQIIQTLILDSNEDPNPIILAFNSIEKLTAFDQKKVSKFFTYLRELASDYYRNRLVIVILSNRAYSDFLKDERLRLSGICHAIEMQNFMLEHIIHQDPNVGYSIVRELSERHSSNGREIIKEVFYWTQGQPGLTYRLLELLRHEPRININSEKEIVTKLVQGRIIKNWRSSYDEIREHIETIDDRLKNEPHLANECRAILNNSRNLESLPEKVKLLGIINNNGKWSNPIYKDIFYSTIYTEEVYFTGKLSNILKYWDIAKVAFAELIARFVPTLALCLGIVVALIIENRRSKKLVEYFKHNKKRIISTISFTPFVILLLFLFLQYICVVQNKECIDKRIRTARTEFFDNQQQLEGLNQLLNLAIETKDYRYPLIDSILKTQPKIIADITSNLNTMLNNISSVGYLNSDEKLNTVLVMSGNRVMAGGSSGNLLFWDLDDKRNYSKPTTMKEVTS